MKESNQPRQKIKVSLRKKILFSIVTTLLFFVMLECVLSFIGFAPHTNTEDPFVGFSGMLPLMELSTNEAGEQVFSTAQNKRHWFNAQSFPKIKKPDTKRIFCMGGSTTYGHPYWDSTSFPGWMREFLPVVDPSQKWEVINAGGISYASYRVAALMEELSQYEPDLFVVYSVHNEFLERRTYQSMFDKSKLSLNSQALLASTRTWALADRVIQKVRTSVAKPSTGDLVESKVDVLRGEVDEILNHTVGPVDYHRDDVWRAKVLHHYETNLRRMVSIARRAGAKIVFIAPTANEKNCSPFKSEHDAGFTSTDQERLIDLATETTKSIANLEEAIKIAPHYADYHYRLGQAYLAVDRFADAQGAFSRALNDDVCPLRAVDEIGEAIERVALELKVPVVDFGKKLRRLCESENGHAIFGDEYFLDHVHPTIDVNRRLALWVIEELQSNKILQGKRVIDLILSDQLSEVEEKVLSQIDPQAQAYSRRNLAKVLHWAGKFEEAVPHAKEVLKTIPNDLESRFILASCFANLDKKDEAMKEYDRLFANGVDYPRAYLPFGELLAERGYLQQAKAYLLMATLHDQKSAAAFYALGVVHVREQEFQFAVESLEESNRLYPDFARTLFSLAQAKAGLGDHSAAISLYEKVLSQGVRAAELHYHYGLSLLEGNQKAKAIEQLKAALELAPDWEEVREQLNLVQASL
jgi:tetratricopeptide (TPR) repeat protein